MRIRHTHAFPTILVAGGLAILAGCTAHSGTAGGSTAVRTDPVTPLGDRPDPGRRSGPTETGIAQPVKPGPYDPPEGTGALEPAPKDPVELTRVALGDLQRVHFPFDSHTLTSEAREVLGANAELLGRTDTPGIIIEGHCDERGTSEYNLALGERRAHSTYQYLADLGVPRAGMGVVSFGEERPLDTGHGEQGWARNRRAEFVTALP